MDDLTGREPTIRDLMEKISALEASAAALQIKLDKESKHNANMDRLNTELRHLLEKDVVAAFERIKNIELKIFPNLAGDIVQLNNIIGDDAKAWNPLDRRKQ
jgi:hypothetical protein